MNPVINRAGTTVPAQQVNTCQVKTCTIYFGNSLVNILNNVSLTAEVVYTIPRFFIGWQLPLFCLGYNGLVRKSHSLYGGVRTDVSTTNLLKYNQANVCRAGTVVSVCGYFRATEDTTSTGVVNTVTSTRPVENYFNYDIIEHKHGQIDRAYPPRRIRAVIEISICEQGRYRGLSVLTETSVTSVKSSTAVNCSVYPDLSSNHWSSNHLSGGCGSLKLNTSTGECTELTTQSTHPTSGYEKKQVKTCCGSLDIRAGTVVPVCGYLRQTEDTTSTGVVTVTDTSTRPEVVLLQIFACKIRK